METKTKFDISELSLHPVPPPKSSMIPRLTQKSQKWVELNHVQPRPSSAMSANSAVLRERRNSSASVKDLVQTFKKLDKATAAEREAQKRLELLKKKQRIKKWTGPEPPLPPSAKPHAQPQGVHLILSWPEATSAKK